MLTQNHLPHYVNFVHLAVPIYMFKNWKKLLMKKYKFILNWEIFVIHSLQFFCKFASSDWVDSLLRQSRDSTYISGSERLLAFHHKNGLFLNFQNFVQVCLDDFESKIQISRWRNCVFPILKMVENTSTLKMMRYCFIPKSKVGDQQSNTVMKDFKYTNAVVSPSIRYR